MLPGGQASSSENALHESALVVLEDICVEVLGDGRGAWGCGHGGGCAKAWQLGDHSDVSMFRRPGRGRVLFRKLDQLSGPRHHASRCVNAGQLCQRRLTIRFEHAAERFAVVRGLADDRHTWTRRFERVARARVTGVGRVHREGTHICIDTVHPNGGDAVGGVLNHLGCQQVGCY